MREHSNMHSSRQPIPTANQIFVLSTQLSSILLETAIVRSVILIKQDDADTDRESSNDDIDDPGVSTLSSNIIEDDFDSLQEVLHLDLVCSEKRIQTARVPLPKKQIHANTVTVRDPLPTQRHLVRAIAPPLLKRQNSTINISCKSAIVQVLRHPNAGGDKILPQPKVSGDHNVLEHQRATLR
jgi:hypothetical protein